MRHRLSQATAELESALQANRNYQSELLKVKSLNEQLSEQIEIVTRDKRRLQGSMKTENRPNNQLDFFSSRRIGCCFESNFGFEHSNHRIRSSPKTTRSRQIVFDFDHRRISRTTSNRDKQIHSFEREHRQTSQRLRTEIGRER